jgi:hypothetical protein
VRKTGDLTGVSTLLPESSTKDRRPFSKINSPPISIFNSVANSEIIDEEETNLSTDGLNLSFDTKNIIDFSLKSDFINDISSLSRVVFFGYLEIFL